MSGIDDLLADIENTQSEKKGKKKGGKGKKNEPLEEVKVEEPKVEAKAEVAVDDLLADIENTQSDKKGKKKGGKGKKNEPEEVKQEEPIKAPVIEAPKVEEVKKQEVNAEEEGGDEEGGSDDEKDDKKDAGGAKKKKKKKAGEKKGVNTKLKKLMEEKKKREEEEEARIKKELEDLERRRKEEELRKKIEAEEAEKKAKEEAEKKRKQLEDLKKYGLNEKTLAEQEERFKKTQDDFKKKGMNLEELLSAPIAHHHHKKKKHVKHEAKEEINNNTEQEVQPTGDEKKDTDVAQQDGDGDNTHAREVENENTEVEWDQYDDQPAESKEVKVEAKKEQSPQKSSPQKVSKPKETINIHAETKANATVTSIPAKIDPVLNDLVSKGLPNQKEYRCPIICILGHVDTGKTKLLDKIRNTKVQDNEAGGITQQIGASFFPIDYFSESLKKIPEAFRVDPLIPGFLIIDTPGHESFQNLRNRGNSICDLAILVVDIMHGLENTTIEAIELLKSRRTPYIIALNKIDVIHKWASSPWGSWRENFKKQKFNQTKQFNDLLLKTEAMLINNNINPKLFDENEDMRQYVSMIPTSAITGEGIPDLIGMLTYISQKFLLKKFEVKKEVAATILEVKHQERVGDVIDVILVSGTLRLGDKIIVGGTFGPIKTTIKTLMTPHPMKEMRVKTEFITHDEVTGAIGVKIFAHDLKNALAGSPLFVYRTEEEAENYAKEILIDFKSVVTQFVNKEKPGIYIQASTLGSLEAILTFMNANKVDIAAVGVGNLKESDVLTIQTLHERFENTVKENLVILAFDVKILPEAQKFAQSKGITIFSANIIYHLFDSYIDYKKKCFNERKKENEKVAVFPVRLKIMKNDIFHASDPIIMGVDIVEGILKVGTPLCIPSKGLMNFGVVEGIQISKKDKNNCRSKEGSVAVKIKTFDTSIAFGRHFDEKDEIVSKISRQSIDALKDYFRDEMLNEDWQLVKDLKKTLNIV